MIIESVGRRRINAAAMVRTVPKVQFEREQELTYAHVRDFLRGAPEKSSELLPSSHRVICTRFTYEVAGQRCRDNLPTEAGQSFL